MILDLAGWSEPTLLGLAGERAYGDPRLMSSSLDPATFANALLVESADIPVEMTLAQWRRERWEVAQMTRRRRRRVKRIMRTRRALAFSH